MNVDFSDMRRQLRPSDGVAERLYSKIEKTKPRASRKAVAARIVGMAAAAAIVVGAVSALPRLMNTDLPAEGSTLSDIDVAHTTPATDTEIALVKHWNEKAIYEQFGSVKLNGAEYCATAAVPDAELLGASLGKVSLEGYDIYEDKTYTDSAEIFELEGYASEAIIAVKYEEGAVHTCVNPFYSPATLGELLDAVDAKRSLTVGPVYVYENEGDITRLVSYAVPESLVWELLLSDGSLENKGDGHEAEGGSYLASISVGLPIAGIENHALSVTRDGWLWTNLLGATNSFYIGTDNAEAFAARVIAEGERSVVYEHQTGGASASAVTDAEQTEPAQPATVTMTSAAIAP